MQLDPGNYLWISDTNKINAYKLNAACNIYNRPHVTLKCDVHDVNRFIFKRNTLVAGYRLMLQILLTMAFILIMNCLQLFLLFVVIISFKLIILIIIKVVYQNKFNVSEMAVQHASTKTQSWWMFI